MFSPRGGETNENENRTSGMGFGGLGDFAPALDRRADFDARRSGRGSVAVRHRCGGPGERNARAGDRDGDTTAADRDSYPPDGDTTAADRDETTRGDTSSV